MTTEQSSSALHRILMVNRPNALTHPGGDAVMLEQLRSHVRQLNPDLEIDLSLDLHPSAEGYDLVHVFNLLCPYWSLPQIESVQQTRSPETPVVLTPTFWDMTEDRWANEAVKAIFTYETPNSLPAALEALAEGRVEVGGRGPKDRDTGQTTEADQQRAIVRSVDHLLPGSAAEMQNLARTLGVHETPFTIVPAAVDPDRFLHADPDLFRKTYGVSDSVLCVGRMEPSHERQRVGKRGAHPLADAHGSDYRFGLSSTCCAMHCAIWTSSSSSSAPVMTRLTGTSGDRAISSRTRRVRSEWMRATLSHSLTLMARTIGSDYHHLAAPCFALPDDNAGGIW